MTIDDAYNKGRSDAIEELKTYWDMQNNKAYEQGRADAIDKIWECVVEEYDNDYCPCVDDYMDYQVTLREIDKILNRIKEDRK